MIYSEEINKICGLCEYAEAIGGDADCVHCAKKNIGVALTNAACRKFKYDIMKRTARRGKKKLKSYCPADFELI